MNQLFTALGYNAMTYVLGGTGCRRPIISDFEPAAIFSIVQAHDVLSLARGIHRLDLHGRIAHAGHQVTVYDNLTEAIVGGDSRAKSFRQPEIGRRHLNAVQSPRSPSSCTWPPTRLSASHDKSEKVFSQQFCQRAQARRCRPWNVA